MPAFCVGVVGLVILIHFVVPVYEGEVDMLALLDLAKAGNRILLRGEFYLGQILVLLADIVVQRGLLLDFACDLGLAAHHQRG